jgi:hypothetical protein
LAGQIPTTLDTALAKPAAETLTLSGKTPTVSYNEVKRPTVATTLTFTGYAPVLGPMQGELYLTGAVPLVERGMVITVSSTSLTLSTNTLSADVNDVRVIVNGIDTLAIAGNAPSIAITSQFDSASDSRFVSLTVDYRIEHIGKTWNIVG